MEDRVILVTGAGGFIGGHLVADFRRQGYTQIRCVDLKPLDQWYQLFDDCENLQLDLQEKEACHQSVRDATHIYNLAADMGGMGFIENNKGLCMLSVLINAHLLLAAKDEGKVQRYFYASSACVYNAEKQVSEDVIPLKEADAYPALPEDGYGWEKLFSERMCRHFREDFGMTTRVWRASTMCMDRTVPGMGVAEKAPAAICRKVIHAKRSNDLSLEIWGNGHQTRSFMYIDDCIKGIQLITESDILEPINLGSDELVTINGLVDIVEAIADVKLERKYNLDAPKGVNGRNSDNTMILEELDWEPPTLLREGMKKTYDWIDEQYVLRAAGKLTRV